MKQQPLLEVKDLSIAFDKMVAVDTISFSIYPGESIALLGESGSGKSITALSILRLLSAKITGEIMFEGENLLSLKERQMLRIRRDEIRIIFQDPMTSLNPTLTIGDQISEGIFLPKKQAFSLALKMLSSVGISEPNKRYFQFPHELSGGMRQRVMFAIAMIAGPKLLIADEPTTALDVTIQAQILELMKSFQQERNMAIFLITHDLRIAAKMADRIIVMYGGKIVEMGNIEEIYHNPKHPYTKSLILAAPRLTMDKQKELFSIPGSPPKLNQKVVGCPFAARCDQKQDKCLHSSPPLFQLSDNHFSSCWNAND